MIFQKPKRRRKPRHRLCDECGTVFRPARGFDSMRLCSTECGDVLAAKARLGYGFVIGVDLETAGWPPAPGGRSIAYAVNQVVRLVPVPDDGQYFQHFEIKLGDKVRVCDAPPGDEQPHTVAKAIDESPGGES